MVLMNPMTWTPMGRLFRRIGAVCGVFYAALLLTMSSIPTPPPVMELAIDQTSTPFALAAISNQAKATAKDVEGKLESAYGDLTDDKGHQLKGKAKQAQASAMNAAEDMAEDMKEAAKTVKKKINDTAAQVADELS